jgi:hypothetical protein
VETRQDYAFAMATLCICHALLIYRFPQLQTFSPLLNKKQPALAASCIPVTDLDHKIDTFWQFFICCWQFRKRLIMGMVDDSQRKKGLIERGQ